jgi:hypothetical protein
MMDGEKHQGTQLTVVKSPPFAITQIYAKQIIPTLHQITVWRKTFQYWRYKNYYIQEISRSKFDISTYNIKNIKATNP